MQEKFIRKGDKILFIIYSWDFVWPLDSGAEDEPFYLSQHFICSVFTGVIFIVLHQQCPWQCTYPRVLIHLCLT